MSYDGIHRISSKDQTHNNDGTAFGPNTYNNDYKYEHADHPNALTSITNGTSADDQTFTYDANGNMLTHNNPLSENRQMLWDESNMMKAIMIAESSLQHNVFSADGKRTLKGVGEIMSITVSGVTIQSAEMNSNYTVYINPYMVIGQNNRMTKHYYSGTERIVSRLAGEVGQYTDQSNLSDSHLDALPSRQTEDLQYVFDEYALGTAAVVDQTPDPNDCEVLPEGCPNSLYFFHPDHLGSSSFLTDETGQAYQFLLYLPWGETMVEERAGDWSTQYKYTGKELDTETGLYDYGARFYDPSIAQWTSVDPMAREMPNWSPYNYTFNNPIVFTDPDGRSPEWYPRATASGKIQLVAEQGDDLNSLKAFFAGSSRFSDTQLKDAYNNAIGGVVVNLPEDNYSRAFDYVASNNGQFMNSNEFEKLSNQEKAKQSRSKSNYNCYHFAINGVWEKEIYDWNSYGPYVEEADKFLSNLEEFFTEVSSEQAIYGETLITMNYSGKYPMHVGVFAGKDKNGNIQIMEKDGPLIKPNIIPLDTWVKKGKNDFKFYNEK